MLDALKSGAVRRERFGQSALHHLCRFEGPKIQDHGPPARPLSRANLANAEGMADNAVDFVENCLNFDSVHESCTGVIDCVDRLQRQIFLSSGMKA